MSQATIAGGRRMSTARCYLDPVRNRRNLHIEIEALTEGLMLDGKRCTGVRYSVAGEVRDARAARAVVVSAGAFNSPQFSSPGATFGSSSFGVVSSTSSTNRNLQLAAKYSF